MDGHDQRMNNEGLLQGRFSKIRSKIVVIEHLQTGSELLAKGHLEQYSVKLANKFKNEVECWKIDDMLDLFNGEIDPYLIGQAKPIERCQDWIAQRNPKRATPPKASPETAFAVLTAIVDQIRAVHTSVAEVVSD